MVILDCSISVEMFSSCLVYLFSDGFSVSELISVLCVVKLFLRTFKRRTVIGATHGCSCNLHTIHAQQMPKTAALAHELVKPIVVVLSADLVDFWNYVCHC